MKSVKLFGVAGLTLLAAIHLDARPATAADTYVIDPVHTTIGFAANRRGLANIVGRFREFEGTIVFDEADISQSKVSVTIKADSIVTGFGPRDQDFRSPNFFNAKEFPEIKFTSTKITKTGAKTGTITGNLTLLGVTRPITLDATFNRTVVDRRLNKTHVGFTATASFDRRDFGMNRFARPDGPPVKLTFEIVADKQ